MSKMKTLNRIITLAALAVMMMVTSPQALNAQKKYASDPQFKVKIDFNRWHDVFELYDDFKRIEKAFPKFVKTSSIGKSVNGLDILLVTVNNPATGDEMSKAGMYIDANIHGNEIQGGEICL